MDEVEKLRPCPFCGHEVRFWYGIGENGENELKGISCWRCHMVIQWTNMEMGRTETFGSYQKRIAEKWNRSA